MHLKYKFLLPENKSFAPEVIDPNNIIIFLIIYFWTGQAPASWPTRLGFNHVELSCCSAKGWGILLSGVPLELLVSSRELDILNHKNIIITSLVCKVMRLFFVSLVSSFFLPFFLWTICSYRSVFLCSLCPETLTMGEFNSNVFSCNAKKTSHLMIKKCSLFCILDQIKNILPFFLICILLLHSCIIIDVHGDLA